MNANDDNSFLNCFICFQKLRRAKMCPYCSKIGCYQCLKLWFESSRMECPYCRQQATLNSFADCGRFVDQLKQKLSSPEEQLKSKDICPDHQIQMRYYCQTCKSPFCPDCSTFEDVHKGHKITLLGKVHQSQKQKIHLELTKFDAKSKEYRKNGAKIKAKLEELCEQRKTKAMFLQSYLKERLEELDRQFRQKQTIIISKLQSSEEDKQLLTSLKETIINNISQSSQLQLVTRSDQTIQLINGLCNRNIDNGQVDFSLVTTSDIAPQFESFVYKLHNFSNLTYAVVYSESYFLNGIEWRLKIYPKGNGKAKDQFLSVFLEMTNAYESRKEYQYRIELINQYSELGSLTRQYTSMFEIGQCWGYNQYIELNLLSSDFLDEDTLIFKFYVRPKGYKNLAHDQQNYIKKLQTQIKETEKQIVNKSEPVRLPSINSKLNNITGQSTNKRFEIKAIATQEDNQDIAEKISEGERKQYSEWDD